MGAILMSASTVVVAINANCFGVCPSNNARWRRHFSADLISITPFDFAKCNKTRSEGAVACELAFLIGGTDMRRRLNVSRLAVKQQ